MSLTENKNLILMKSSLSIICLTDHTFSVVCQRPSENSRLFRFSPVLSPRCLTALPFTLRNMIQSEAIMAKRVTNRKIDFVHRKLFLIFAKNFICNQPIVVTDECNSHVEAD